MSDCKECMTPTIEIDINHLMASRVGHGYGIERKQIKKLSERAEAAYKAVANYRGTGWLGWTELPYNQSEIVDDIIACAQDVRGRFKNFVVLGIGGSALGPIAVQQALNHLHYNDLADENRPGPRFFVEDNIDPERMKALLDVIDVRESCFNIITKSGATAETMSQYLIISAALKATVGEKWHEHIIATTDKEKGNLIKIAKEEGFRLFYIPSSVGGRFSELSPVGLLPAAVCGIDIRAMLKGAQCMDQRCQSDDLWENPALMQAVLQYIATTDMGINIQVVMPYADSLRYMADWFCQLWAESIGKNVTRKGRAVNVGQTPTKALGVTDQHSQLQLYTEGPYDKIVTFLRVGHFRDQVVINPGAENYPDIAFLGGKTLNELIEAEYQGTQYALCRSGRMSQTITLPIVNAHTVGQLLYFFELATAYMGELLDIDAFNQPGVEESKIASYAVLGNKGDKFRQKQEEMAALPELEDKYIFR